MMIDMFAHICPKKFIDYFSRRIASYDKLMNVVERKTNPSLCDIERRLEIMDRYEGYVQVLVPSEPEVEAYCSPEDAAELASVYNDAVAEIVDKYPDRFVGAVACVPLNNIQAALKEIDRAINDLGLKGIYLNTPVYTVKNLMEPGFNYETAKPLDSPEFMPIYESMSKHNLPIWIHPHGDGGVPVYRGEERGKYVLTDVLGWPIESAMAMARLVCSGVLAKYPNLRFIIHHCGSSIIPALAGRLENSFEKYKLAGMTWGQPGEDDPFKTKHPADYFRMFYADTALYGDVSALMCGHAFFGVDHMVFGTDYPWDVEGGDKYLRQTISAINRMNVSDADKKNIFEGNAKRILRLDANRLCRLETDPL